MNTSNCQRSPRRSWLRPAFTLVELLVVMVIIGVLIAILLPVVFGAISKAQESAVATEIATMSASLQAFKSQYQTNFPPDFSGPENHTTEVNRVLSSLFRYRATNIDTPVNPNSGKPVNFADLDHSESLVFWLSGFSSDPQRPLTGGNKSPLFDFDQARLADRDQDGFPEYYPAYGNQSPYLYYMHTQYAAAYENSRALQYLQNQTNAQMGTPAPRPYLRVADPTLVTNFVEPNKFQILAAGLDGQFGVQVAANSTDFAAYLFPNGPYPDKAHRDNITNFAAGSLERAMP